MGFHFIVESCAVTGPVVLVVAQVVVTQLDPQILVYLITGESTGTHFIVVFIEQGGDVVFIDTVEIGPTQFGTAIPGVVLSGCVGVGRKQA